MKTVLPVEGYASASELMEALQGTSGDSYWLAKAEGHWHGGIHLKDSISGASGFRSMTDGHIVAYRLNDDYQNAPSGRKMVKFTSTFVLIKSTCTPDAAKPANALDFYTLWMQLAPLSKYGVDKPARVAASSLKVRQDSTESGWVRGGIPAGEPVNPSGDSLTLYGAPADSGGTLPRGAEVEILDEASFFLNRREAPFAYVRVVSVPDGHASSLGAGETGWVSGLDKYLKRQPSGIPDWMQKAKAGGVFNQVVTLAGDDLIAVSAGEKIGHAGNYEFPGTESDAFSHLEVFSQDSRFADFLANKAGVTLGDKLVRSEAGKTLWLYREMENSFVVMGGEDDPRQTSAPRFTRLSEAKKTDADGQAWYFIKKENGWLPASDVTEVEQYDLASRGFLMLVEDAPPVDVRQGYQEGWLRDVYGKLSLHSTEQNGMYSLSLTEYYQTRLRKWDLDGDQKLSGYEVWRGLHCREDWCLDIVQRLVVKHHSEWLHDSDSARWQQPLSEMAKRYPGTAQYNRQHINALVWMKDVPEIRSGEALWHMHPIMFLDALTVKNKGSLKGKLTYDAEGNNIPSSQFYSRVIHWPGNDESGVTLGRGYDMGNRSEESIYQDMIASGVDATKARKISLARRYKGSEANSFVTNNRADIGEITEEQQVNLFNIIYPGYVTRAIANYNSWTSGVSTAKKWEQLDAVIQEVLVDFVYQGFTKGPNPMLAGANNDKQELISYIRNTPGISKYEPGRHRANYLEKN